MREDDGAAVKRLLMRLADEIDAHARRLDAKQQRTVDSMVGQTTFVLLAIAADVSGHTEDEIAGIVEIAQHLVGLLEGAHETSIRLH